MKTAAEKLDALESVFNALAHEQRRHILLTLRFRGGGLAAGAIAKRFACSWPTTTRHLQVLESAGLLSSHKIGRERHYKLEDERLLEVAEGWLSWFHQEDSMSKKTDQLTEKLRVFGLKYPGAHLKSPWPNHKDLAVKDKTFAYISVPGNPFSISCKLPESGEAARQLPFVTPTEYGLGKWGWVTAKPEGEVDMNLFKAWIDESYRAIATKTLIKELDGVGPKKKKTTTKKKAAKTPAKKR